MGEVRETEGVSITQAAQRAISPTSPAIRLVESVRGLPPENFRMPLNSAQALICTTTEVHSSLIEQAQGG